MKKILLLVALIVFCSIAKAQNLESVKALNTPSLSGQTVSVFYSDKYRERAVKLQAALEKGNSYFKEKLSVENNLLYLTVFDADDYKKLRAMQPYGLPFVTGNPPIVFLPATSDGAVAMQSRPLFENLPPEISRKLKEMGYDIKTAIDTSVDLIGFHELGHLYALKLGIHTKIAKVFWLKEFLATYLAYSYLVKNEPKSAELWRLMSGVLVNSWKPDNQSLREMEKVSFSDPKAYSWYQSKIVLKTVDVYKSQKLNFVKRLKKFVKNKENPGEEEILNELAKSISDVRNW
jgi:hypothetical protein